MTEELSPYLWGNCPDCGAEEGRLHIPGCDVERCKKCGRQAIGCDCDEGTPSTRWKGHWPGDVEVAEGLATDLNDLLDKQLRGILVWDSDAERLYPKIGTRKGPDDRDHHLDRY